MESAHLPNLPDLPVALLALLALAVLLAGRKLYWLFVAAVGFTLGLTIFTDASPLAIDEQWGILLALLAGLAGAIIALFFQKLMVALAGAGAGAFLGVHLAKYLGASEWNWLAILIGVIFGAILMLIIFDWALIFLSSFIGASMLVRGEIDHSPLLFLGLFAVGLLVQGIAFDRAKSRRRRKEIQEDPAARP
jgi:MFS family permease